jgi:hypothetical protein
MTLPKSAGFTIVEVMLTLGIITTLTTLSLIALVRPQTSGSISTTNTKIVADIKNQQLKAMTGATDGDSQSHSFGIYFENNRYILFRGLNYSPSDTNNFVVNLDSDLIFSSVNLPSNSIVFAKRSGEVVNFNQATSSFVLSSSLDSQQISIRINGYGAINQN